MTRLPLPQAIQVDPLALVELKDMLAFYETPSGRSMLAKTPALMQESVAIGQAWGARKAEAVIARIQAEQKAKRDAEAEAEAGEATDAKG